MSSVGSMSIANGISDLRLGGRAAREVERGRIATADGSVWRLLARFDRPRGAVELAS